MNQFAFVERLFAKERFFSVQLRLFLNARLCRKPE